MTPLPSNPLGSPSAFEQTIGFVSLSPTGSTALVWATAPVRSYT